VRFVVETSDVGNVLFTTAFTAGTADWMHRDDATGARVFNP
jgi:hypothetical protein